jgi:hypothetical protein
MPTYVPKVPKVCQRPKTIFSTNVENEVEYAGKKLIKKKKILNLFI